MCIYYCKTFLIIYATKSLNPRNLLYNLYKSIYVAIKTVKYFPEAQNISKILDGLGFF